MRTAAVQIESADSPVAMTDIAVTSFYKFFAVEADALSSLARRVREYGELLELRGLVLFAAEGVNATVSGRPDSVATFKTFILSLKEMEGTAFKDSRCGRSPFRRFSVQIRDEIVTLKRGAAPPPSDRANRLTPSEWQQALDAGDEELVVLDVRNDYEIRLGKFRGAIDPGICRFSDFPEFVSRSGIPKRAKVLMYCTGGIRCEKAIGAMQEQGYTNVFQLDGGILRYLEELPAGSFEGECFVFDHRVALDQQLSPSKRWGLCPHCGNPASDWIDCARCAKRIRVCESCRAGKRGNVCSKNCAYHQDRAEMK